MKKDTAKKFAIGTIFAAAAGYLAGILTAPQSGKETRQDIKDKAESTYAASEKQLKKLHTELSDVISSVSDKFESLKDRKEVSDALDTARDMKQKTREILSSLHDGEAEDKDLQKAINDATKALDHLRDYLKK